MSVTIRNFLNQDISEKFVFVLKTQLVAVSSHFRLIVFSMPHSLLLIL